MSNFCRIAEITVSFIPLAKRNSSKSSGNILTLRMLPIGIDVVFASVTPSKEPLATYVNLSSCDRNLSKVSKCGYA